MLQYREQSVWWWDYAMELCESPWAARMVIISWRKEQRPVYDFGLTGDAHEVPLRFWQSGKQQDRGRSVHDTLAEMDVSKFGTFDKCQGSGKRTALNVLPTEVLMSSRICFAVAQKLFIAAHVTIIRRTGECCERYFRILMITSIQRKERPICGNCMSQSQNEETLKNLRQNG